jgi:hypothetical protein
MCLSHPSACALQPLILAPLMDGVTSWHFLHAAAAGFGQDTGTLGRHVRLTLLPATPTQHMLVKGLAAYACYNTGNSTTFCDWY